MNHLAVPFVLKEATIKGVVFFNSRTSHRCRSQNDGTTHMLQALDDEFNKIRHSTDKQTVNLHVGTIPIVLDHETASQFTRREVGRLNQISNDAFQESYEFLSYILFILAQEIRGQVFNGRTHILA